MNTKSHISLYAFIVAGFISLSITGASYAAPGPMSGETETVGGSKGVVWHDESKGLVDWTASVLDPATGGVQLPDIPYRNVQAAYADTAKKADKYYVSTAGASRMIQLMKDRERIENEYNKFMDEMEWSRKEAEEKLSNAEKTLEKLKSDAEKIKEFDKRREKLIKMCQDALAADDLGNGFAQNLEGIDCNNIENELSKYRYALTEVYPELGQAIVDYRKERSKFELGPAKVEEYNQALRDRDSAKKQLEEIDQQIEEHTIAYDDASAQNDIAFGEMVNNFPEKDKKSIISDLGSVNPSNFDQVLKDPTQRHALQQRLDNMSLWQSVDKKHFDLSTETGRRQTRALLDALYPSSNSTSQ